MVVTNSITITVTGLFLWRIVSSGTCSLSASCLSPAWFDSGYILIHVYASVHGAFYRISHIFYGWMSSDTSFLAVTCSVAASPEDYKKCAWSGRWLHGNVSVYSALLVRRWIHAQATVHGGSWKNSIIFYVKGFSYVFYVQDLADVAVFFHRHVPAGLSGVQTVQKNCRDSTGSRLSTSL